MIRAVPDPSAVCARLTARLPDWFGLPEANAAYIAGVAECDCLGAYDGAGTCQGLIALRPHFGTTLEIWWMAVAPDHHRQGLGTALVAAAVDRARGLGCRDLMLMTLDEAAGDPGYDATRRFYLAQGFRPLVRDHLGDPDTPLIWMIRPLQAAA